MNIVSGTLFGVVQKEDLVFVESFEAWYDREHDRMVATLLLTTGSPDLAAESVDEACSRVSNDGVASSMNPGAPGANSPFGDCQDLLSDPWANSSSLRWPTAFLSRRISDTAVMSQSCGDD